ncbi:GNAT family N-acetyltransferase [Actinocatenispora rupis]|nr:GNAT family N-acetyltransferase [Actinocatenispora rupis]
MALGYVRTAREDEAGEIARIQLATWRTAFSRIIPERILSALDESVLADRWRQAVTAPPSPGHHVLVAVEQGEESNLVGFAAIGPADESALAPEEPADALGPRTAAVTDLLVEPRWGRRGHGSRLLAAAVDLWRTDGHERAVAWLFDRDKAGRGLLASAGWATDGAARALDMDGTLVRQSRLHVSLAADDEPDA